LVERIHTPGQFLEAGAYLSGRAPANLLMLATFEGQSSSHLASSIHYDRTGMVRDATEYMRRPRRYLARDRGGRAVGVAVAVILPEFGAELDFETYVVIDADTEQDYRNLLRGALEDAYVPETRLELVTFRPEHAGWTGDLPSVHAVHEWLMYGRFCGDGVPDNHRVGAPDLDPVQLAAFDARLPPERSVRRALRFERAGLPYRNLAYPLKERPEALVGIRRYCSGAWEVHYSVALDGARHALAPGVRRAIARAAEQTCSLVWRVRAGECVHYGELLADTGFTLFASERHLHITPDGPRPTSPLRTRESHSGVAFGTSGSDEPPRRPDRTTSPEGGSMHVALIAPNNPGSYRSAEIVAEHLGLSVLAATLERGGHRAAIVDARFHDLDPGTACLQALADDPRVVGVSLISMEAVDWTRRFANALRAAGSTVHLVLGGYFPTLQPERALQLVPQADSVVLGEGEVTLLELVRALEAGTDWRTLTGLALRSGGGVTRMPRRPLVTDLDALPWPRHDLVEGMDEGFEVLIEGSRGCSAYCTFCAVGPFMGPEGRRRWRARSPGSVVAEMAAIRARNPRLRRFRFVDPDFLGAPDGEERARELAAWIREKLPGLQISVECRATSIQNEALFRDLKEAGLIDVYVGVESGSQRILDLMNKRTTVAENLRAIALLQRMGIGYTYGFMMFTPWTTEEDLRANVAFLRTIGRVQFDKLFHEMDLIPATPALGMARRSLLVEKGSSGYFSYDALPPSVGLLREVGRALNARHQPFLRELWFLYKDAQYALLSGDGAEEDEQQISEFFLEVFEECKRMAGHAADSAVPTPLYIAEACVDRFGAKARQLAARHVGSRFPREGEVKRTRACPPTPGPGRASSP